MEIFNFQLINFCHSQFLTDQSSAESVTLCTPAVTKYMSMDTGENQQLANAHPRYFLISNAWSDGTFLKVHTEKV